MSRLLLQRRLLAGFTASFLAAAPEASLRGINRAFPVQPGYTLVLDTYHGEVAVEESETAEIRIELNVDCEGKTEGEATHLWEALNTRFDASGNTVRVVARNGVATGPRLTWQDESRMNLYYRITVPRQCHLELKTRRGHVNVPIDPAANCDLDAVATWGKVESTLNLAGASSGRSQRRVTGRLNQGGAKIKIHADGGSVTLAPGEMVFEPPR
jgi:hypothetical protein